MITFDLSCANGHRFEGWFQNREAFEDQHRRGLVSCPLCGSTAITKELSAVAVHVSKRSAPSHRPPPEEPAPQGPGPAKPAVDVRPFFRAVAEFVEKHFEDVGTSFAEEARKIARGEAEARNIRGTTTPAEEAALEEDGIAFLKVPVPKYDA
ncbi:MAG: DUF1178 family protein [Deferrisomatales bacterium]